MNQYNFPTIILSGQGALKEFCERIKDNNFNKSLIVTDGTLKKIGLVKKLTTILTENNISYEVFSDVHPNPDDNDVKNGVELYKASQCDSLIALGGGSPMDTAKVIKIMVSHEPPLSKYDDALGGDKHITEPMPPLYAIPKIGRAHV